MKRSTKIGFTILCALVLVIGFACTAFAANNRIADNLGYYPTNIRWGDDFTVEGYFYNLNADVDIMDIRNFKLSLYDADGYEMISGDFTGSIPLKNIYIPAFDTVDFSFTMSDTYFLPFLYNIDDGYTADFSCNFTSRDAY